MVRVLSNGGRSGLGLHAYILLEQPDKHIAELDVVDRVARLIRWGWVKEAPLPVEGNSYVLHAVIVEAIASEQPDVLVRLTFAHNDYAAVAQGVHKPVAA